MNYETFLDKWNELADEDKINCFNEYAREYNADEELFLFDEDFFNTFFTSPLDAVRACFFGNIESWSDEYIKFNGYANLESLSDYQAAAHADDYTEEIFNHPEIWLQYIEEDEEDEDEEPIKY